MKVQPLQGVAAPAPNRQATRAGQVALALARLRSRPRLRDMLLALLLAAPVPLVMAFARDVAINYTHQDVFIPLDAAWRTVQGQWPHADYYTPLGLAYVGLHGAAAWLFGMDGRVVIWANLIALPFVLGPAMLLAWRRLNVLCTVVLAVVLAVLVMSPTFLDGPERLIAHLANYNRIGGGLCAVVCLWALCPPAMPSRVLDAVEAVALGAVFLILLYLKVTFFALAAATALAGCLTVPGRWRRTVLAAGLAVAGVAALELLHPGLLLGYLADVRRAGAANTQVFRPFYAAQAAFANLPLCLLVGVLAAGTAWLAPGQRRGIAGLLAVAGACVLVATQNFGAFSPPLVVLVMLLAQRLEGAGMGVSMGAGHAVAGPVLAVAGMFAVVLAIAPFLQTQIAGTIYQAAKNRGTGAVLGAGRSEAFRTVRWLPNPIERAYMPETFTVEEAAKWVAIPPALVAAAVLDDGLDLLIHDGLAARRIASLSFSNPFPAALGAPPPRGVALWWDEDRTFTTGQLTPGLVLGDADVVMVPKFWWGLSGVAALLGVAQPALTQDFVPHQSRYWTAWERKPGAAR